MYEDIEKSVKVISIYEGISIEEAMLTYATRKKLPKGSFFCGPNLTYPANDSEDVQSAFARLNAFGHRLPKEVRDKIYRSLISRAKKFGVTHDPKKYKWGKTIHETKIETVFKWFIEELEEEELKRLVEEAEQFEEALWIQKAIKHKGALRKRLGIKEDEKVPVSVLNAIKNAETGKTVSFKGKKIKVTTQLKRQAILALRLRKMPRRGK